MFQAIIPPTIGTRKTSKSIISTYDARAPKFLRLRSSQTVGIVAGVSTTVYGIPSCQTVKKARAALEKAGIDHDFVDFRETPPKRAQIETWVAKFGANAMRNTSGGSYRALGEEKKSWSDKRWTAEFAKDAMLLKRPIIEVNGEPVAVGFRQPEQVLQSIRASA